MLHRNSQKRYYEPKAIYFIVTKTFENILYFKEPIFCELFIEELKLCREMKKFKLFGFSLIYNHLNLLIQPSDKFNVSKVMKSLKENISRDINYLIENRRFEGDTSTCRLQMRDILGKLQKQFIFKYGQNQCKIPKFKWQKSFHDHVIRDQIDLENHYIYTAYNHQKHNLPADWKYTSLNYKYLIDEVE